MLNYGIELEFFVSDKEGNYIPAYKATSNTDGNPVIGEIKTKIYSSITDCVFEMDKLLYLEREKISNKGYILCLIPSIKVDNDFLKNIRNDAAYINKKSLDVLSELSIYGKATGKILPRGIYKASLQLNISDNNTIRYIAAKRYPGNEHYTPCDAELQKADVFDYVSIIRKLDDTFSKEISEAKRVRGVYAIKDGDSGKRIEYRSLPNNIYSHSLISALK